MALIAFGADNNNKVTYTGRDLTKQIPIFGVRDIGGGTASVFGEFFISFTATTVYFWCDTSGKLRYGTTEPTVATQNSAGTAIGS